MLAPRSPAWTRTKANGVKARRATTTLPGTTHRGLVTIQGFESQSLACCRLHHPGKAPSRGLEPLIFRFVGACSFHCATTASAPLAGLEPTTHRLTICCSTIELQGNRCFLFIGSQCFARNHQTSALGLIYTRDFNVSWFPRGSNSAPLPCKG